MLALLLAAGLTTACGENGPEPSPSGNSTAFGEYIPIPDISATVEGDYALELKTTNEGIYMLVHKGPSDQSFIYRLQSGGPSPQWYFHEQPNHYFDWEPTKYTSERPDEFAIYFQTIEKNGYVSINSDVPALQDEDNPMPTTHAGAFTGEMLYDNSSGAYKYMFDGNIVRVKQNNTSGEWDEICRLSSSIEFAEAEPWDAVIWAAAGKKLYKITVNGDITEFDVSSYHNPDLYLSGISKIRFNYDPLHKDVYFRCQEKVFRIVDGKTLELFYTIDYGANFLGGDFAIDNGYMYATDGTKKSLYMLTETNIIPPAPQTTNQQEFMEYYKQVTAFNTGPIEVLKNNLSNSIYVIAGDKLLKVPKSR